MPEITPSTHLYTCDEQPRRAIDDDFAYGDRMDTDRAFSDYAHAQRTAPTPQVEALHAIPQRLVDAFARVANRLIPRSGEPVATSADYTAAETT